MDAPYPAPNIPSICMHCCHVTARTQCHLVLPDFQHSLDSIVLTPKDAIIRICFIGFKVLHNDYLSTHACRQARAQVTNQAVVFRGRADRGSAARVLAFMHCPAQPATTINPEGEWTDPGCLLLSLTSHCGVTGATGRFPPKSVVACTVCGAFQGNFFVVTSQVQVGTEGQHAVCCGKHSGSPRCTHHPSCPGGHRLAVGCWQAWPFLEQAC